MKLSVIVPTFLRPQQLRRCIDSLAEQKRLPDEVVVVVRESGDEGSREEVRRLAGRHRAAFPIREAFVREAGHLAPIRAGALAATGDVACFIDDDAEADPEWLSRLAIHYERSEVGGVGGSAPLFNDQGPLDCGTASEVGLLRWYGRLVGDYYRDIRPGGVREVHFFMGCNMSYRRELLLRVGFDFGLNRQAAYLYEVDLGLQILETGHRLIFDPDAKVRHYPAPRPVSVAGRDVSSDSLRAMGHNYAYIMLKHLPPLTRMILLPYLVLFGSSHCPGLAWLLRASVHGRWSAWSWVLPVWRGVLEAFATHRRRRGGRVQAWAT